jgi:malonyl-CoA/methylmalonyl-CoA synthetase
VRAVVPPGRWPEDHPTQRGDTLLDVWKGQWSARAEDMALVDGWRAAPDLRYGDLDRRSARLAAALVAEGVRPGDRVLWQARASLSSVTALLGVLRAGGVVVPLSPSARTGEVAHVVHDARPRAAIAEGPDSTAAAPGPDVAVVTMERLLALADAAEPGGGSDLPRPAAGDDALIVYTSGTTGRPKGAAHTHASLLAGVSSLVAAWRWGREDRLVLSLPLFHVHGLCAGLFGTLAAGASAVVFDRFDEGAVLGAAPQSTMFFGVPTMYHRLARSDGVSALSGLRLCVSGSAPLAADLWHQLAADGVQVLERYGMTETLLTLSNPLEGERRPGSVGVPLPGVEAVVEDVDAQGVGELLVRGACLCRGYWGQEPRPAGDWFATGDLVSVAEDGYVTIRGRRTELIITGGHNVYPAEVESVLSRHPGVVEVAVVGLLSVEWGETVVAFVVGDPDVDALHALAQAELAPFKRPREVRLVEALPRNALGKVLRSELR